MKRQFLRAALCLLLLGLLTIPAYAAGGTLVRSGDGFRYYEHGRLNTEYYGFVNYNGGVFLVAHGRVVTEKSGLARDPNSPDDWYYLSSGQVQTRKTGLVQYDGEWFYVDHGRLDTTLTAMVEYDGGMFLVARGRVLSELSGLAQDPADGLWYFFSRGQVQNHFTGLASYRGVKFYVQNGWFDDSFCGQIVYKGRLYEVRWGRAISRILGEGRYEFYLTIIQLDGSFETLLIRTNYTTVGDALVDLGLIEGERNTWGMYVTTVDGVESQWKQHYTYWVLYVDGELAMHDVIFTPVTNGCEYTYRLEYWN